MAGVAVKRGERRKRKRSPQKASKAAPYKAVSDRQSPYIRSIAAQHRKAGWPYGNVVLSIVLGLVSWLAHSGNERGIALVLGISAILSLCIAAAYLKRPFKFNGDCPKCGASEVTSISSETTPIVIRHSYSFDERRKELMRCGVCAGEWELSFPVRVTIRQPS